jgi:biofilm PGA synthesis N-glycosyltransferase PgaC
MKNNRPPFPGKAVFIAFAYILTVFVLVATVIFKPVAFNTYKPLRLLVVFFASILLAKYFFYMIISPLHTVSNNFNKYYWKKRMPRYRPKVSVIIPAWNEEIGILTTVKSVLLNDYNNMEVIIINDGSTDRSDAVIKEFVKKYNAKKKKKDSNKSIVYKYKKNEGKGSALNQAISISSGEIIISIDADCRVDSKAIKNFVQHFRNPNVSAAVGNVKIGNTKSLLGLIQYLEFTFSFYLKKQILLWVRYI